MARRRFSREFKLEAVRLAQRPDVSVAEVARLGLHDHVLRRWIKQYEEDPVNAFPGGGHMKPEQAEIAALKRFMTMQPRFARWITALTQASARRLRWQ